MIAMDPVAFVRGGRAEPIDDDWGKSRAVIELAEGVPAESLASLDQFSHAEIIFVFDRVTEAEITRGARHPRGARIGHWWASLRSAARTGQTALAFRCAELCP